MKTLIFVLLFGFAQASFAQVEKLSPEGQAGKNDEFIDKRDGQTYPYRKIGNLYWMTKNLNYSLTGVGWCYGDNTENCRKYGVLYTWHEAQKVCPKGWHLPEKTEFESLLNVAGKDEDAFYNLIKGGGSGFSVVYAGWKGTGAGYGALGEGTNFWTTTESGTNSAWVLGFASKTSNVELVNTAAKICGFSVRCVKD